MQLRPRLFLEGNLFVDVQPGTPSADELDSGSVIPLEQTSISVQFDQVLTSLQKPVREDLQAFLKEFGTALCGANPPDDGCEPARAARASASPSAPRPPPTATRAQVNEALLGTEPGDLAGFIRNLGTTVAALDRNQEQLKDFITNFRIVTGSFAAEDEALEQAIAELDPRRCAEGRPALAKLNDAPSRRCARSPARRCPASRPRTRPSTTPTRGSASFASSSPSPSCAAWSRTCARRSRASRALAKATHPVPRGVPLALLLLQRGGHPVGQHRRALGRTASDADAPVYKHTGYGLTGVAGESRSGDANGQWFRVLGGGGTNTVSFTTGVGPTSPASCPFDADSAPSPPSRPRPRPRSAPTSLRDPGAAQPEHRRSAPSRSAGRGTEPTVRRARRHR